jgi:hypothetical protein
MIAGLTTTLIFGQKVENRAVSDFTGIDASGAFNITVVKGATESLTIEADDEVMQYVRSEVKNGVLRLYLEKNRIKHIKTLKASVVMKDFDKVSLSGACKIITNDTFIPVSFTGNCSGASDMVINLNAGQLTLKSGGTCNVDLTGSATDVIIDMSGASNLKAGNFTVRTATIKSAGSSSITINVTDTLNVNSSGASTVKYKGSPATDIKSSGASSVKKIQ